MPVRSARMPVIIDTWFVVVSAIICARDAG
jgi:hypothetical protein